MLQVTATVSIDDDAIAYALARERFADAAHVRGCWRRHVS